MTQPLGPSQPDKTEALSGAKFRVERIRITGNAAIGTEELHLIVAPYTGKEMDLSDLQKVTALITDAYKEKGYTLARAYVPQQEIKDGVVEIAILEGRVGEIIIKGNKHYSTDFIKRGFTRVTKDKAIKHSSLEKCLLLLNENPDLKVTAVSKQAKSPAPPISSSMWRINCRFIWHSITTISAQNS